MLGHELAQCRRKKAPSNTQITTNDAGPSQPPMVNQGNESQLKAPIPAPNVIQPNPVIQPITAPAISNTNTGKQPANGSGGAKKQQKQSVEMSKPGNSNPKAKNTPGKGGNQRGNTLVISNG